MSPVGFESDATTTDERSERSERSEQTTRRRQGRSAPGRAAAVPAAGPEGDGGDGVSSKAVETYYDDGEWKSRRQGSSRAFAVGGTKTEQVAKGREAARRDEVEHIIKNKDGTISARNSYGNDPSPPAG
jgi:hypothetical protein